MFNPFKPRPYVEQALTRPTAERADGSDSTAAEARWREERIDSIDRQILDAYAEGDMAKVDRLFDYRNGLRRPRIGAPPVIPGRAS